MGQKYNKCYKKCALQWRNSLCVLWLCAMGGYNKVVPNGGCVYAVMCSVCSHIVSSVLWFWQECFIAECLVFYKSNIDINQKGGFCVAKVWFLACKKVVFTLQKYGFCNAKVGILCMLLCYSKLQVYVGAQFYGFYFL